MRSFCRSKGISPWPKPACLSVLYGINQYISPIMAPTKTQPTPGDLPVILRPLIPLQLNASSSKQNITVYRRWDFKDWRTGASGNLQSSAWEWSHPQSWTGNWEIGQLFLWTFVILATMFSGFLFIAILSWTCGFLDDRRVRKKYGRAGKGVQKGKGKEKRRSQMLRWKLEKPISTLTAAEVLPPVESIEMGSWPQEGDDTGSPIAETAGRDIEMVSHQDPGLGIQNEGTHGEEVVSAVDGDGTRDGEVIGLAEHRPHTCLSDSTNDAGSNFTSGSQAGRA